MATTANASVSSESHLKEGLEMAVAEADENHKSSASQSICENHDRRASHKPGENH